MMVPLDGRRTISSSVSASVVLLPPNCDEPFPWLICSARTHDRQALILLSWAFFLHYTPLSPPAPTPPSQFVAPWIVFPRWGGPVSSAIPPETFLLYALLSMGVALMAVELIRPRGLHSHASVASTHCGDIHLARSAALPISSMEPYALY